MLQNYCIGRDIFCLVSLEEISMFLYIYTQRIYKLSQSLFFKERAFYLSRRVSKDAKHWDIFYRSKDFSCKLILHYLGIKDLPVSAIGLENNKLGYVSSEPDFPNQISSHPLSDPCTIKNHFMLFFLCK